MRAARPKIGDRATSDVVVRLRTPEGRDEWLYCHSGVLTAKSRYFADRLSDDWPTCQILDSRYCVEVCCQELDLSSHVTALRLLYADEPCSRFGVRGALGVLQAAVHLGCAAAADACAAYLESAPWDEADEEEILRAIPCLGPQFDPVLARLRPIDPAPVTAIFLSAFRHATSGSPALKFAAQEQLEYMLAEDDDDAPLLLSDDDKLQVKNSVAALLSKFSDLTSSILKKQSPPPDPDAIANNGDNTELHHKLLHSLASDISWLCQVLTKLEMMKCLVPYWVASSSIIVEAVDAACPANPDHLNTKMKVMEVSAKVLESIAFGNVLLPADQRCHAVKVWMGFAGRTKPSVEQPGRVGGEEGGADDAGAPKVGVDGELWQGLESAIVSILLTLPSDRQAEILAEWLQSGPRHVKYPDLTEAFEVWCYRSKVARRRLSFLTRDDRRC